MKEIDILKQGAAILSPVLEKHGFSFQLGGSGQSSGGPFATGCFVKKRLLAPERQLDFSFRFSLGQVTYHIGQYRLEHEPYMRFLGVFKKAKYPGFSDDPLDAFQGLAEDLENYGSDFLYGDGKQFSGFSKELQKNPNQFKGFQALE